MLTLSIRRFAIIVITLAVLCLGIALPSHARPLAEIPERVTSPTSWQVLLADFLAWFFAEDEPALSQATEKVSGMWVPDGLD